MLPHTKWRIAAYAAFVAAGGLFAYWTLYGGFAFYDDEGYVVLSIREFLREGGLYTHVYSQYGPFTYEFWGAIYRILGIAVTPDTARTLMLCLWLLVAGLAGLAVERVTHSIVTGLITAIAAFTCLGVVLPAEIMIPDDLTTLIAIAMIAAAAFTSSRPRLRAMLVGALVGALLLTKINIGGAVLLAVCLAFAVSSPLLVARPWVMRTFAGLGVIMPLAVVNSTLSASWADNLVVVLTLGIVGVCLTALRPPAAAPETVDGSGTPDFIWFVGAVICSLVVLALIIIVLGTRPGDLVHGVLIGPLGQPGAFKVASNFQNLTLDLAVLGMVCACVVRREPAQQMSPVLGGSARILLAIVVLLYASGLLPFALTPDPTTLGLALPFMWLAAAPPTVTADPEHRFTRLLLASIPTFAAIGIYPVAGAQIGFASVLCLPAAALILGDGATQLWRQVHPHLPAAQPHLVSSTRLLGLGLLAVLGYQALLQPTISAANAYAKNQSLGFAGAKTLRLAPTAATDYANLVRILMTRCDQFVTLPGMNSFYLWTGQVPPTGLNVTAWMFLLDRSQQQQIVDKVLNRHRLCLVQNSDLLAFWDEGRTPPNLPLYKFVTLGGFKPIYSAGGYTISRRST